MRKLNEPYEVIETPDKTKSRILLCALHSFALHGYDSVTMKQLADACGIQAASIYNHYPSKEDILNSILNQTEELLDAYYYILDEANQKAESFQEIIDNLYAELLEISSDFIYYGLTIAQNTQFLFKRSREVFCDNYVVYGHEVMTRQFDIAVEKGFIEPCDTRMLASVYGSTAIAFVQIHAGKFNGYYDNFDAVSWYQRAKDAILALVQQKK